MKLGILKTDNVRQQLVDTHGEYPGMFQNLLSAADGALEYVTYEVMQQQYPANLDDCDAYLMTGSKFSVYDDELWIARLGEFVQQLHAVEKKLVGICFGHQMVAHFLGGRVEKSVRGWGIGVHEYFWSDASTALDCKGNSFHLLCSHQDQVVELASASEVLAGSEFCPYAMTRIGQHVLTLQAHPEFSPAYAAELFELRREIYPEDVYLAAMASMQQPVDAQMAAGWIVNFLLAKS